MSEEKVFKNQNRNKPQILAAEEYVPEHVKMMVEAEVYKPPMKHQEAVKKEASIRSTLASAPKRKVLSASKSTAEAAPESEMSWVANSVPSAIPNLPVPTLGLRKEEIEMKMQEEVEQRLMEEEEQDAEVNAPISEDEVLMPGERNLQEASSSFEFASLTTGEYVLVFQDSVVETGTAEDVSNALSTILSNLGGDNVSIEDFVVLKRVPVETGVFVDRFKS